uniref:Interleukin-1 receptor-associated kinase 4 n=1 Tax=Gouania willdenowi TaxID=441366 RepID=A0A8C5E801_GOUWI
MNDALSSHTYIRQLNFRLRSRLSDFLDSQDRWKAVIGSLRKPSGDPMYSQMHIRRFEGLQFHGRSPTHAFLEDWGTTNSTVGELVELLKSLGEVAAARVLLPEAEQDVSSEEPQSAPCSSQQEDGQTQPQTLTSVRRPKSPEENTEPGYSGFYMLPYSELKRITGNFDDRPASSGGSHLGEGGFGTVFKGCFHNRAVAVKKLNSVEDVPLEKLRDQFNQEIKTLQMLKHRNLVDMIGFSCDEHLCLMFAFMANGSLLDRLACLDRSYPLTWRQRCLIAEGIASGLEYLHNNHHVHRDVKSANILLDEEFVAKISDFGLTRALVNQTSTTMTTDRVLGTRAYMAPEALRGEITPKSDIFSFGVVLLEILSGLPPADENREQQFLIDIRENIEDEDEELTLHGFVDPKMKDWDLSQVECIYMLASNCLHNRKNRRPLINVKSQFSTISLEQ